MPTLQTRIFVTSNEAMQNWAETLIGRVLGPLIVKYRKDLSWFWFARYVWFVGHSPEDKAHCNFEQIPRAAKRPPRGYTKPVIRSIRFRFQISRDAQKPFELSLRQQLKKHKAYISDIREYDLLGDLGGDRFVGDARRNDKLRKQRCKLIVDYLYAVSKLFVDALVGPDNNGRFAVEANSSPQNPQGSTFESLHHLFCNLTQPPLMIYICKDAKTEKGLICTAWSMPLRKTTLIKKLPVNF
jgi:hypothetical protein